MGVVFHPPGAEGKLQAEYGEANEDAGGNPQVIVQRESPIVEQHGSYDALSDIIGETHPAVGDDTAHEALQAGAVVSHQDARHQHEHEGKLMERRYHQQ